MLNFFGGTILIFAVLPMHAQIPGIEQVIARETEIIGSIHPADYGILSEKYSARGESYLLLEQYPDALDDFQMAYELADKLPFARGFEPLLRSLTGQLLTYGNLDDEGMTDLVENEILTMLSCANCARLDQEPILLVKKRETPIVGPEKISIGECRFRVFAAKQNAYALFQDKKLKESVVTACQNVIDAMVSQAEWCCAQGTPWKICLQPLLDKWLDWFQNGIPKKVN